MDENKNSFSVLDLYAGDGKIWNEIKNRTGKDFKILRIDQKNDKTGIYLKGNNIKFLRNIELRQFDIIDCDAYGIPYQQLKEIFRQNYKGTIFITYIQSMFGKLPNKLLFDLGYTKKMIDKIPTLFNKDGLQKLKNWLAMNGISRIKRLSFDKKHYLSIKME